MSEVQDLRQRRLALQAQLDASREQRNRASRENSFALSRQRTGITQHDDSQMKQLAADEIAEDAGIVELRSQIESIDVELAGHASGGVIGRVRSVIGRRRP